MRARTSVPSSPSFVFKSMVTGGVKNLTDVDWVSTVRVDGDKSFANVIDMDVVKEYGWRFQFQQMQELGRAEACYEAGETKIDESVRKLTQIQFEAPANFALERLDRLTYTNEKDGTDGDFLVDSLSVQYVRGAEGEEPRFDMSVGLIGVE